MNPRELRIGNWVRLKHHDFKYQIEYHELHSERMDDIEPILITPEWLERFGFENIGTDDYHSQPMFKRQGCDWKYCLGGYFSQYFCEGYNEPATVGDIQYVHQLQNAYFVLTGEELTIGNHQ